MQQLPRSSRVLSQTFGAPVPGCRWAAAGRTQSPAADPAEAAADGAGPAAAGPHCSAGPVSAHKGGGGRTRHRAGGGSPVPKMVAARGGPGPVTPHLPREYPRLLLGGGSPAYSACAQVSLFCWKVGGRKEVPTWPVLLRGGGRGGSLPSREAGGAAFPPHPSEAGPLRGAPRRSLCGSGGATVPSPPLLSPAKGKRGFRTFLPIFPCNFLVPFFFFKFLFSRAWLMFRKYFVLWLQMLQTKCALVGNLLCLL